MINRIEELKTPNSPPADATREFMEEYLQCIEELKKKVFALSTDVETIKLAVPPAILSAATGDSSGNN